MDGVIYLFTPNWMKRVVQLSHTIPVVLLSEKSDDIPLNTISLNGFRCGYLVAKYLLDLGHKSIAFLMSSVSSVSLTRTKRLEGTEVPFAMRVCRRKRFRFLLLRWAIPGSPEAEAGYFHNGAAAET